MTLDEFRQQTFNSLVHARSRDQVRDILADAADTLRQSDIQRLHQRQFWAGLYSDLKERQQIVG